MFKFFAILSIVVSSCNSRNINQGVTQSSVNEKLSFYSSEDGLTYGAENELWKEGVKIDPTGRKNIYKLDNEQLSAADRNGRITALNYPVNITGLQLPIEALKRTFDPSSKNPALKLVRTFFATQGLNSLSDIDIFLGLAPYPAEEGEGVFYVPMPPEIDPTRGMGNSIVQLKEDSTPGMTYSCAACHAGQFFGKSIIGMSTRFPQANQFLLLGKELMSHVPTVLFHEALGIKHGEVLMFKRTKIRSRAVDGRIPVALGLDTSLAQVSLSLTRRRKDGNASRSYFTERFPRHSRLRNRKADSKPAVWWNVKYKNKWLLDGSVVSGNPILTNFLWNEIGRGTDLDDLERWIDDNQQVVRDLTAMLFASEPPTWGSIFGRKGLNLNKAIKGKRIYDTNCARCHGSFEKGWERPEFRKTIDFNALNDDLFFKAAGNESFTYHETTPVIDVGTDPLRYLGMKDLEKLNDLDFSKKYGVVVKAQKGYVPPPLLGIFARYPYFHNNSVSSLCEVLTKSTERKTAYRARRANDSEQDFNFDCVGYPDSMEAQELVELKGRKDPYVFRTDLEGASAKGHDEGIFIRDGQEVLTATDKEDLIFFLKTL